MNNGQVAGYVNYYHAVGQAFKSSIEELTQRINSYERREQEIRRKGFFRRLFSDVGDPEEHIINQFALHQKLQERAYDRSLEKRASESLI